MPARPIAEEAGWRPARAGSPGTYQAVSQVPMIGEYNVTVEVRQPMAAQADHRIDVQTVKKS